jgi:GT2 family glycosyltransferase
VRPSGEVAAPVSVVIPTIGRSELVRSTLESVIACEPPASEVLVVDQGGGSVRKLVESFRANGIRYLGSPPGRTGPSAALNDGLRAATFDTVLTTHDDARVDRKWVGVAHRLASVAPECIFTGRVLPDGGAKSVPSIKTDTVARDYTGETRCDALYHASAVLPRKAVLSIGGFDERLHLAAEDNDLCYRWLKAGRCLRYEPALLVWHADWRPPDHMPALYARYGQGQGQFYAKHLRRRDWAVLRFLAWDLRGVGAALRGVAPPGYLRGIMRGLLDGWGRFR